MFVTEIQRGFDWALGAWPDMGAEKSISYSGESKTSTNHRQVVAGSWLPSHFAFKDCPAADEFDCLHDAIHPQMDERIGKHCLFIKGYRLGIRRLHRLAIQLKVPTISGPPKNIWKPLVDDWKHSLRQVLHAVSESYWNIVPNAANFFVPPPPFYSASTLHDSSLTPATFLSKIGPRVHPRHPLDDVIQEIFDILTDAQAVVIHDDEFEALKQLSADSGQPSNKFQLNHSQSGRCVSFTCSGPSALPLYDLGHIVSSNTFQSPLIPLPLSLRRLPSRCAFNKSPDSDSNSMQPPTGSKRKRNENSRLQASPDSGSGRPKQLKTANGTAPIQHSDSGVSTPQYSRRAPSPLVDQTPVKRRLRWSGHLLQAEAYDAGDEDEGELQYPDLEPGHHMRHGKIVAEDDDINMMTADGESVIFDDEDIDLAAATAKTLVRLRRDDLVRLCESRELNPAGTMSQLAEALLEWRDTQQRDFSEPSSVGTSRPRSIVLRPTRPGRGRHSSSEPWAPLRLQSDPPEMNELDPNTLPPKESEPELELDLESLGLDDREIPYDQLVKLEKIGSGGFKDVFIGKLRGRKVAIAEFRGQLNAMDIKELKLLSKFNHPNVVRFHGVSIPENTRETPVMIVSELCSNGDLFDYVRNVPPPPFHRVLSMMLDIAKGIQYLHNCKPSIIHRDCKSSNILITSKGTAKITDFGLAKVKQSTRSMVRSLVGTVNWQAPELWSPAPKYNHTVDVFSLAVVYWEILQWHVEDKKYPWEGMNEHAIYEAVGQKHERPSMQGLRKLWCPEIVELVPKMWAQEPADRLTITEVVDELEELLEKYS
ncbi:kinase-like domain-containing protein [Flagelloscypha sp. PMI_526]|nr:kinase-like domain-containing protein [Flagelloscypha sp. PMI_526]